MTIISGNFLADNDSSFETSVAGWTAGGNTTIAQSTAHALNGTHSMSLTSTAAGTTSAFVSNRVNPPLTPGTWYACYFSLWCANALTAWVSVDWYSASNTYISTTTGTSVTLATNTWTLVGAPMVSVATATQSVPIIDFTATAGSQAAFADLVFFGPWIPPTLVTARQAVKRAAFF
ncbi:hypothetical protein ACWGCW_00945 [Streptomyces sp. NPDC054933]